MKRFIFIAFFIMVISTLNAKIVGIVTKFKGNVLCQKNSSQLFRRVYLKKPIRNKDKILVKSGSVTIMYFNGKLTTYSKGQYIINSKKQIVSYDQILEHNRRIVNSGISKTTGATRAKYIYKPVKLLYPGESVISKKFVVGWKYDRNLPVILKKISVYYNQRKIWKRKITNKHKGLMPIKLSGLKKGLIYRCVIEYFFQGKINSDERTFSILSDKDKKIMKDRLKNIDKLKIRKFMKHYLKSVLYSKYNLRYLSVSEFNKAKKINPKLG